MVSIELLGTPCLRSGEAVLSGPPVQRHRIALLALAVDAWPHPLARDRVLALLWPERDDAGARRLLNLSVHVLRGALGEGVLRSVSDGLVFDPSQVRCDLHEVRSAITSGDAARIAALYAGPLLDGFHLAESSEFMQWLDSRRRELDRAHIRALAATADAHQRSGDGHALVATCRRLVAAEPHSTEHALRLMRALDAAGDRAAAIQHAGEHARRVAADLELDADPAVGALAEALRRAPARVRLPTVAVLPFRSLGGDPEHEAFADGITEDVIAHLSRIRALRVISRSSVMAFRERRQSIREIGSALGAAVVLDGSVRRSGDRLRIVAALIEAESERQLWAETYDRQLADVFAIQTDVALRIAAALEAELTPDESLRVRRTPTGDVAAYQLYAQGRRWFTRYTLESLERARDHYALAIEKDPGFAQAHAALAMTFIEMAEHGAHDPDTLFTRAADAAETALRLDPGSSDAHAAIGSVRFAHDYDWTAAEFHFRRALELNPGGGDPCDRLGRLYASLARYDEAVEMMERAQLLDPLTHKIDVATMLIRAGRYGEAAERARHAVEFDRTQPRSQATLGWALFFGGRRDEGLAALQEAVALSDGSTLWLGQLGEAYGLAGDEPRAREILAGLDERAAHGYVSPYHLAYVHTGLGEAERAIDLLEEAVSTRSGTPYSIKGSFLFAPLRAHPRFRALLRTMNLEASPPQ
jgi:serine/threonine-protein kinase